MTIKHKSELGTIALKKGASSGTYVAETSVTQYNFYSTPAKTVEGALQYLEAAAAREVSQALKFQALIQELKEASAVATGESLKSSSELQSLLKEAFVRLELEK